MKRSVLAFLGSLALLVSPATFSFHGFLDVLDNNVYHDATYFMVENGYASGYGDGNFLPFQDVNRMEALKMIMEFAEIDFVDVDDFPGFPDINEGRMVHGLSSHWECPWNH